MLEFTFLGTSSGVPTLQRNVSALALKNAQLKSWCLVDCGEGTQQQLLRTPHSLVKLSAIFITHVHGDHCYGLPGLLASAGMAGRREPLKIIAPKGVKEFVLSAMQYTDMYMAYELEFIASEELESISLDCGLDVKVCELSHRVPSYGYRFEERSDKFNLDVEKLQQAGVSQGPVWGLLKKQDTVTLDDGRVLKSAEYILPGQLGLSVIVGGDNDTPELLTAAAKNAHVLIHETTYLEADHQRIGPKSQHSDSARVARFAQSVDLPNLVLTHFSARYHKGDATKANTIESLAEEAKSYFDGEVYTANDFDTYLLNNDGKLSLIASAE